MELAEIIEDSLENTRKVYIMYLIGPCNTTQHLVVGSGRGIGGRCPARREENWREKKNRSGKTRGRRGVGHLNPDPNVIRQHTRPFHTGISGVGLEKKGEMQELRPSRDPAFDVLSRMNLKKGGIRGELAGGFRCSLDR